MCALERLALANSRDKVTGTILRVSGIDHIVAGSSLCRVDLQIL
jgi:hypothetical protein